MKRMIYALLALASPILTEEATPQKRDVEKISETMGHLIGKNLQSLGLSLDIDALVRGVKECSEGKTAPLSDEECVQALADLQEQTLALQAKKNLAEANEFLQKNSAEDRIVSLEEGKVQYRIEKPGEGAAVESYNSPVIRYKGTYLNGQPFAVSLGDEMISLDESMVGFAKGIQGMKEGEVRTIYIHPDLGYGKQNLPNPNALLVFEIELLKADASAEAQAAVNAEDSVNTTSAVR